jgi:hypothetical protein
MRGAASPPGLAGSAVANRAAGALLPRLSTDRATAQLFVSYSRACPPIALIVPVGTLLCQFHPCRARCCPSLHRRVTFDPGGTHRLESIARLPGRLRSKMNAPVPAINPSRFPGRATETVPEHL